VPFAIIGDGDDVVAGCLPVAVRRRDPYLGLRIDPSFLKKS